MGCSQSKIENEEAVSRCKDRKQFMKSAVTSRNAFAAAHSSYAMALKNTGAALSDFAHGEALHSLTSSAATAIPISDANPSLPSSSSLPADVHAPLSQPPPPPTLPPAPPPPPIPDLHPPPPLQRAVSMPEFKTPRKAGRGGAGGGLEETIVEDDVEDEEEDDEGEEEVEELVRRERGRGGGSVGGRMEGGSGMVPPPPVPEGGGGWYDFFNVESVPTRLGDVEEVQEEVFVRQLPPKRMERVVEEGELRTEVPPPPPVVERVVVRRGLGKGVVGAGVGTSGGGGGGEGKRRSVDMVKVFNELDDYFLKASECAHEVSKMLEAARLHYHSNFADNRGMVIVDEFKIIAFLLI